jgi:hypothetical protein
LLLQEKKRRTKPRFFYVSAVGKIIPQRVRQQGMRLRKNRS